jgi:hypothetical protein
VPATPTRYGHAKCAGHPDTLWARRTTDAEREALAGWFLTLNARIPMPQPADFVARRANNGTQREAIQTVPQSDIAWVGHLSQEPVPLMRGLVVARITVEDMSATGGTDRRYGTGPQRSGPLNGHDLMPVFFIVALDLDDADRALRPAPEHSYRISQWEVWGIDQIPTAAGGKKPRMVKVKRGASRSYRLCAVPHPLVPPRQAQFTDCLPAHKLQSMVQENASFRSALDGQPFFRVVTRALLAKRLENRRAPQAAALTPPTMIVVRQVIEEVFGNVQFTNREADLTFLSALYISSFDGPGWMPCGVGCCTADI